MVRPIWFFVMAAAIFGTMVAAAFLSGEPEFAIPVALVGLVVLAYFGFTRLLAHQAMRKHDDSPREAMSDETDPVPATALIPDEETALGDTREAHADINPHDFPAGAPERAEVERLARLQGGTTSGAQDRGEDEGAAERPAGKSEGYPAGESPSAPRGRS